MHAQVCRRWLACRDFREAGLDPKIIGYKRVERCIARWKAENAEKAAETAVENSENQGE